MHSITKKDLEFILNSTHDGMIAVNGEGIVNLFNWAAENITGLKASEIIGRLAVDSIPNTRLHIVLKEGTPELNQQQSIENTVILTNRFPIRDESDKVIGAVAVFRDITELKHLSEQVSDLWKARNLLEAVIDATEDAISVADEKGNNIIVNPAYTRITGFPKDAVIGKPVTVDIAEGESMHLKVLKTGQPVHNIRMKVGPLKKEVIVNVAPIFIDGDVKGSVGVIHDISEIISLNDELAQARKMIRHLKARYTWDDIIGESPSIEKAKEQARNAAETPATILLRGESGTGKELFAHALHNASGRSKGQFVRVNCAAIAETLLESELFGYEEGAFTGAAKGGKKGFFEEASGGTIFLDEIGVIDQSLQRNLLRTLQEKEIVRVGGTAPLTVDVRVIAATNANLEEMVKDGSFRDDLYYRLNVMPIYIPPLRERKEDITLLAESMMFRLNQEFGREVEGISSEALDLFMEYDWPGNVRELENIIGRAMINMPPSDKIVEHEHLPLLECEKIMSSQVDSSESVKPLQAIIEDAEKNAIARALRISEGNREKAANLLGIALRNLYYKIKKYEIK
jgi:PAS domain S-box-containing protein